MSERDEQGFEAVMARSGRSGDRDAPRPIQRAPAGVIVAALCLLLFGSGCASVLPDRFGGGSAEKRRPPKLRLVRPEAPADYDVLIAELAQAEGDFVGARAAYERAAEKDPEAAFIHDRLARIAWQLEDVEGAVLEAERAFELDPDSMRTRLFLGRLYRLQQDEAGLDRVLRDEAGRPLDADAAYALFQVAMERGDLAQAEALALDLAEEEPDQLRGTLALASVHEQKGDFDAAEDVVRQGLERFPDHFLLYMRLAQVERTRGDRAGEIEVYREILRGHPGHYGILQRMGQAQLEANDLEGAIATFDEIVRTYPEDLNSLRRLASIEFSAGRYEAAAARLEAVLERAPEQPALIFALGQIHRATGDTDAALTAYERIEPDAENYFDARLQIASIHESEGRSDEALAELERLRLLRPNRQVDFHVAALRAEQGDLEGGIALLEGLLDGSDDDADVHYQMGVLYGQDGNVDEALRSMQKVLEVDPDNSSALNYIGYSWAERGENLEEAEALIRRALELSPEDGYITDSLGWVYYKMAEERFEASRKDEALRLLDRAQEQLMQASELTGGDAVVSEHLGDVFLLRGDKPGALDCYEEAVELEIREAEQPNLMEKLDRLRRESVRGNGRCSPAGASGTP